MINPDLSQPGHGFRAVFWDNSFPFFRPAIIISILYVNVNSSPSLGGRRAAFFIFCGRALKKKNGCPRRAHPLRFVFLRPGPSRCPCGIHKAGNEAGLTEKENIMSTNTETKKAPVAKIRAGSVTASIWENASDKGTRTSVTFQRGYKDKDGKWHNSDSYSGAELLELSKVALEAYDRLRQARNGDAE
jgi:hypothetical protein